MKTRLLKFILLSFFLLFFNKTFAIVVTVSGNNSSTTNGITSGTISYGQANIVLYGFTISSAVGGATVTGFQLSSTQPFGNYFTNFRLVSCSSTNYTTGTKTPVSTAAFNPSGTTLTVTSFGQSIPSNGSVNYFLVADFTIAGTNNITFQVNNFSNLLPNTLSLTTTGIPGNIFSIPPPTITVTGNNVVGSPPSVPTGNGISPTTLTFGQTGVVFYGFSLTDSNAPTSITAINLFANNPIAAWCTNFKIYRSPTTVFDITTATQITTATITTAAGNTLFAISTLSESFTLGQSRNYFIVADFTNVGANIALPNTTKFGTSATQITSTVSNTQTVNSPNPPGGQTFNLSSPILTIANYSTGVYTGSTIAAGGTYNLLGFNLSYSGPINMHQIVIDLSFATGSDFNSGYINSVNLIDASTGLTASHLNASGVQNQGSKITINFDGSAFTTSTNYYVQVTFASSFSVHKPGSFTMCLNAASNPTAVDCQNNSGCIVNDVYLNSNGTACSNPYIGQSIYDWVGSANANGDDWNVAANWSPVGVPGTYDIAREGVANGFNKLPVVYTTQGGSSTINVGSIIFGNTTSGAFTTLGVTVNNGYTLNVNGDITLQSDAQSFRNYPINLAGAGTGTIQAANLNIISTNSAATHALTSTVNSSVPNLILSGNIALTSNYTPAFSMAYNSTFNLTGGTAIVNGVLQSTNAASSLSTFAIIPASSAGAVLQFNNATALSGLSTTANSNTLSFNNANARVDYLGSAAQTIYTDAPISGLTTSTGPIYYSLRIGNSGIKTPNGGSLQIYGDFVNNRGTGLILTTTPVLFKGSTAQSLKDGSGTNTLFNTVTFSGAGTKTISSGSFAVASTGTLTVSGTSPATILDAGSGLLTLYSDANSTATIAKITGGIIKGNVNVQRYISGGAAGYRGYRLLSSPVNISSSTGGTGNIGLSYLNTGIGANAILTAGPGGIANGFSVANANPLIYLYDETRVTNYSKFYSGKNVGVSAITGAAGSPNYSVSILSPTGVATSGVTVPVGNSFLIYYVGSAISNDITSILRPIPDATTVTALGCLNQGPVPVTFWNTNSTAVPYHNNGGFLPGLNQVGNPYPSTISLDQLYIDNPSISPQFWELNEPGGTYMSYNASSGATSNARASKYIVSGQGFVIQALGTGETLTFQEGEKVAYPTGFTASSSPGALLMSMPATPKLSSADVPAFNNVQPQQSSALTGLHLQITKDSVTSTQTGIYFNSKWSDAYKGTEDAVDLDGTTPKVYLSSYSSDGNRLGINQLGNYTKGKRIKLYAGASTTGLYTISLVDIANIDSSMYKVYLVDKKMNDSLDMIHNRSYAFNIDNADTTTYGANRFVLSIKRISLPPYSLITFSGQKVNNGVELYWQAQNTGTYTGFVLQKLSAGNTYNSLYTVKSDNSPLYAYVDQAAVVGNNTYRLQQTDIDGKITYSSPVTINFNNLSSNGTLIIYPNPSKSIINVSVNSNIIAAKTNYLADIYNTSGTLIKHKQVSSNAWTEDISAYKLGIYIIELKTNSGDLVGKSKFVKVN